MITDWYILLEEAPPQEEIVTPESIETDQEPVYEEQVTIKADWMVYDVVLNTIKARGNVSVEADDQAIFAEQAVVNLDQETGTFKKATILGSEKDLHLEAEVIVAVAHVRPITSDRLVVARDAEIDAVAGQVLEGEDGAVLAVTSVHHGGS